MLGRPRRGTSLSGMARPAESEGPIARPERPPGVAFRAMSTTQRAPQRAPRTRSAFAAAFLSLLFPGLGHAYAGAYARALGFAAAPLLLLALGAGIVLRIDRAELVGMVANQAVLIAVFIANVAALVYRVVAAVDAWQVARFLNAGGRVGQRPPRARADPRAPAVGGRAARGHPGHRRRPPRRRPLQRARARPGRLRVQRGSGARVRGGQRDAVARRDRGARRQRGSRRLGPPRGQPHRGAADARSVRPGHDGAHPAALGRQGAPQHPRRRRRRAPGDGPASTRTP